MEPVPNSTYLFVFLALYYQTEPKFALLIKAVYEFPGIIKLIRTESYIFHSEHLHTMAFLKQQQQAQN
jgi:hypothetical protein